MAFEAQGAPLRYDGAMEDALFPHIEMTALDWLADAAIALAAFAFGCLQLYLAVNLLIPDEAMRRFLGIEALVPTANAIAAVAVTTLPLVLRRRLPWPCLVFVLAAWAFGQTASHDISLSIVGPLVALFTVAYCRTRPEAIAATCLAALFVLIVPTAMRPSYLVQLTLIQNHFIAVNLMDRLPLAHINGFNVIMPVLRDVHKPGMEPNLNQPPPLRHPA